MPVPPPRPIISTDCGGDSDRCEGGRGDPRYSSSAAHTDVVVGKGLVGEGGASSSFFGDLPISLVPSTFWFNSLPYECKLEMALRSDRYGLGSEYPSANPMSAA